MTFWLTLEQRRALRTWSLVMAGPALLLAVAAIVALLTWAFAPNVGVAIRLNYLGSIALVLACLIAVPLLTYAAEISLRSFKGSAGGVSFEATGGDQPAVTATVTNAVGDTATATVPTSSEQSA